MTTQQTRLPQRLKTSFRALCRRPRRTLACSKIPSASNPATRPVKRDHRLMRAEQQEVYKVTCHPVTGSSDCPDQTAKSSSIVALMLILNWHFAEAMSPGGLVPEITNGRGAMAAMLIAFVKEVTTGKPVAEQIKSDPIFIAIVFGLIIVGSIVPVFRGADLDRKGAGPFTPRAEIWNGRVVSFVAFPR